MKNSKQKIWLKITCVNVIVLSITQNYPSTLLFSKHYWVLSYLKIIGWTQSLQFRNKPTFWRQNNCSRIHCSSSWDVVTHQHSGDPAILERTVMQTKWCRNSPTFWWPCNLQRLSDENNSYCRNSPTFWWPCNKVISKGNYIVES